MPEPTQAEVISRAIVKESLPKGPAKPDALSKEGLAQAMAQKLEDGNWRGMIEIGAGEKVDKRKVGEKIEQIGVERDADGKKARATGTPEKKRYDDAKSASELAVKFTDVGYDKLSVGERDAVRTQIEATVLRSPLLADRYNSITSAADKQAFLERIARDPKFNAEVKGAIALIANSPELQDTVSEKKDLVKEKEDERDIKQTEIDDVDRRVKAVERQLKEFERPAGGGALGAKAQELKDLKDNLITIKSDLSNAETERDKAQNQLDRLKAERQSVLSGRAAGGRALADVDADIVTVEGEIRDKKRLVGEAQAKIDKIPQLEAEERTLEEQKATLETEKRKRQDEMNKIKQDLGKRQREYQDALLLRESQEQDIVDGFKGVFGEATGKLIDAQVQSLAEGFDDRLAELKKEAADGKSKAVYETLDKLLVKRERRRRWGRVETVRKINKANVNRMFSDLMTHGPDYVVKGVLNSGAINPDTGNRYTPAEVDAVMKDKNFVEGVRRNVASQILARKILSGGISQVDAMVIGESDWGQNLVSEAAAKSEEFRKQAEELMGKDAINQPGFAKRFLKEMGSGKGLLALLLLGLPLVLYSAHKSGDIFS